MEVDAAVKPTRPSQLKAPDSEKVTINLGFVDLRQAERFMQAFLAEIDNSLRPSELSLPIKPVEHEAMTLPPVDGIAALFAMRRHPNRQE